jgi:hypothetical protein
MLMDAALGAAEILIIATLVNNFIVLIVIVDLRIVSGMYQPAHKLYSTPECNLFVIQLSPCRQGGIFILVSFSPLKEP